MVVLAIVNQKGGSAKTTTAVNLASSLASIGKKTLLIDFDPQGSSTSWLKCKNESKDLYDVFVENTSINDIVTKTSVKRLFIIPSNHWLLGVEKILTTEVGAETVLKKKIKELDKKWDFIFIDCPPALGVLSLNALVAAEEVLVPLETRVMALEGLAQLLRTIDTVQERLNPSLKINGIVPCRVDKRTKLSLDIIKDLKMRFKGLVYETYIRENIKLAESPSFGMPINFYDKKSHGAIDYKALAKEMISRKRHEQKDNR